MSSIAIPCGSSSGSAVAVAARLAPLAVGTETDGSIVCPAAANGVVGIKPTIGTVSQRGIVPIAHSQDTAGPLARTVADAALLLAVLVDPGAPRPLPAPLPASPAYASASCGTFSGAGREPDVEQSFAAALGWLARSGRRARRSRRGGPAGGRRGGRACDPARRVSRRSRRVSRHRRSADRERSMS